MLSEFDVWVVLCGTKVPRGKCGESLPTQDIR